MENEEKLKCTAFKDDPSPPLPLLELPSLARFHAESARKQASISLSIRHIHRSQKRRKLDSTWNDEYDERKKLKELFQDANKVVKENKASISRFYEIIREQRMQKIKLGEEIFSTQTDIEEYENVKETMEKYVKDYSIFETFLENVAADSTTGDLFSVRDILNRYEMLEATRSDLARILEAEMEAEAQLRRQMIELTEDKATVLKYLANHLVMLQVARRDAFDRRIYWEMIVQRIKNMILAKEEEHLVLGGACWDLYNLICRRRRARPAVPAHDIQSQLDYIQKSIVFYKEVLTVATGNAGMGENERKSSLMDKSIAKEKMKQSQNM